MENKKTLPPEQHSTLLQTLKDRFEKTQTATKTLNGIKYKQNWKPVPRNCGRSMKWKERAANPML